MNKKSYASIIVRYIYGEELVPEESWLNYAYSLLVISGADGVISQPEYEWLTNEFTQVFEHQEEFRERLKTFDYKSANLQKLLRKIRFNKTINFRRALLYDAVKMATADDEYSLEEKRAVKRTAVLLEIPMYIARSIEGLVNTERSLSYIRKSIFQLDEKAAEQEMYVTNNGLKDLLGIGVFTNEMQQDYGEALMIIAGADGKVSKGERRWYAEEFAVLAKTPPEIIDSVLAFDFKAASLVPYLKKFSTFKHINFARTLIYNAIKMSKADNVYALEEQKAIVGCGEALDVSQNMISTMEYLINTEENIMKMRKTLFYNNKK